MAGKTTPWWRDFLTRAVREIRAGVAAFFRPAKVSAAELAAFPNQETIPEEEAALSEDFPQPNPESNTAPEAAHESAVKEPASETHVAAEPAEPLPAEKSAEDETSDPLPSDSAELPEAPADLLAEAALGAEAVAEPEAESDQEDAAAEEGPGAVPESPADMLAEAALGVDPAAEAAPEPAAMPEEAIEQTAVNPEMETEATAAEPEPESAPEAVPAAATTPEPKPAPAQPAAAAPLPTKAATAPLQAVPHEPIKREQGPDTSPVSVLVSQVYDGPFDLLLDLIRKQDIDIYDIPIAKITAQFLTYVNQLKASDMDVAGEFIYTASLLIHIKSKMLLPREPKGLDDAQEDPRRELVERLLEHERFKNAAQMLQQKQMLEAATWTNPGVREFRDDAGADPEIAADTTDLVRIFREILERARSRPILNVEEDSVTVGQMIQFLGRRLTMEDKPVALRRLLAHTKSERALIAMFLALLELVRLQAILLRQDRHFSEIFIKKSTGFDGVMNQGLARDDWQ